MNMHAADILTKRANLTPDREALYDLHTGKRHSFADIGDALRLDYQITHILVDECQDTAINQYDLVHALTRGWGQHNETNPQAPRTVMMVGDGMQSIYGFRNANVGLFLQARELAEPCGVFYPQRR